MPTPALDALTGLSGVLSDAGIPNTTDAGSFVPDPLGVLVGLPALESRGLATNTYAVPVRVVSGRPLNRPANVDALYTLADRVALVLDTGEYVPVEWSGGLNADPLPAILITVTVTVTQTED